MQIQIFKAEAALATQYEASVAKHMQAHERGNKHKPKLPKSASEMPGRKTIPKNSISYRILHACREGKHTAPATCPSDVCKTSWTATFNTLFRSKHLDRQPFNRRGARFEYSITQKGRDALKEWGDV